MAVDYLKRGKSDADRAEDDAQVRAIVEATQADIGETGDAAVREYSEKFDDYSPEMYRLGEAEIDALIAEVPARDLADIRFSQEQVRNFARIQQASMTEVEVETLPGVILGHRTMPVQSVGCYVPAGKFPMVATAHKSVATGSVAGVPRIVACTAPFRASRTRQ